VEGIEVVTAKPKRTIKFVEEFSDTPGGRLRKQGAHSGEAFRDEIVRPALANGASIEIDLNDAIGFPASFLDEAFGRLVELEGKDVFDRIEITLTDNKVALELLKKCVREHGGRMHG
jgi:uncharacterized protein DUF4325